VCALKSRELHRKKKQERKSYDKEPSVLREDEKKKIENKKYIRMREKKFKEGLVNTPTHKKENKRSQGAKDRLENRNSC